MVKDTSNSDTENMPAHNDQDLVSKADAEEREQGFLIFFADGLDDDDLSAMDCAIELDLEDMELDDDEEADIKNDALYLHSCQFYNVLRRFQQQLRRKKQGEQKRQKCCAKN